MEKQLSNSMIKTFCIERMKSLMDSRQSLLKEALPDKALFEPYQKLEDAFIGVIEAEAAFLVSIKNNGNNGGEEPCIPNRYVLPVL